MKEKAFNDYTQLLVGGMNPSLSGATLNKKQGQKIRQLILERPGKMMEPLDAEWFNSCIRPKIILNDGEENVSQL